MSVRPSLPVLLLVGALAVHASQSNAGCRQVAGTIDATVIGGDPVNVLGTVSGDLAGATRAVLTGQEARSDGATALTLTHDFVTRDRSSLNTTDTAIWTPIPGHTGMFHMATTYTVEGGTGAYAGASGSITNDGMADTNTGLVTLSYAGEICVN